MDFFTLFWTWIKSNIYYPSHALQKAVCWTPGHSPCASVYRKWNSLEAVQTKYRFDIVTAGRRPGGKLHPLHCAHPIRKLAAECKLSAYHSGTAVDSSLLGSDAVSCECLATFRRLRHVPEYLNPLHFIVSVQVSFVFSSIFVDTWRQRRLVAVIVVTLTAMISI